MFCLLLCLFHIVHDPHLRQIEVTSRLNLANNNLQVRAVSFNGGASRKSKGRFWKMRPVIFAKAFFMAGFPEHKKWQSQMTLPYFGSFDTHKLGKVSIVPRKNRSETCFFRKTSVKQPLQKPAKSIHGMCWSKAFFSSRPYDLRILLFLPVAAWSDMEGEEDLGGVPLLPQKKWHPSWLLFFVWHKAICVFQ